MGQEVDGGFSREDRQAYREKVKLNLEALKRMLDDGRFEVDRKLCGMEVEFYVVDDDVRPANLNDKLLNLIESEDFQTELAQFNIEFNLAPHKLIGTVFREMEEELLTSYHYAQRQAATLEAQIAMIGILPTLDDLDMTLDNLSKKVRYRQLNDQIMAARGEDFVVDIEGTERVQVTLNSIMMEAAATSVQLHLQVTPGAFAHTWNAAQAIAAAQVAVAANSPFLLGKETWRETRIALFEQAIDTRTEELTAQGVRPRVWFGERWIDSALDLFDENVRYFPSLLPELSDQDPIEELDRGGIPHLHELTLHNGTIYRWNRPVYGVARGKPHFRVENRVLPAGPTMVDVIANAAFYYGLVRSVAEMSPAITQQLSFAAATDNFFSAARDGIEADVFWPGVGDVPVTELVLRTLLPLAHEGLDKWEVDRRDRDYYLGIIEQRCLKRINGSAWMVREARAQLERGLGRRQALQQATRRYLELAMSNEPVHTWEHS